MLFVLQWSSLVIQALSIEPLRFPTCCADRVLSHHKPWTLVSTEGLQLFHVSNIIKQIKKTKSLGVQVSPFNHRFILFQYCRLVWFRKLVKIICCELYGITVKKSVSNMRGVVVFVGGLLCPFSSHHYATGGGILGYSWNSLWNK